VHEERQSDGRIRRWAWNQEEGKYLRVIVLEDGKKKGTVLSGCFLAPPAKWLPSHPFLQQANRFDVDGSPRAHRHDLQEPVFRYPVDDPEPSHTVAPKPFEFGPQWFAGERVFLEVAECLLDPRLDCWVEGPKDAGHIGRHAKGSGGRARCQRRYSPKSSSRV